MPLNSLVCDYFHLFTAKIADGSVDAVIIDPPYTDGKTDALPNHKIQTKIDIGLVMREAYRILKPNGFFVFFGQMPTVLTWLNEATAVFRYKEHITWCKRNVTSPYLPIQRNKEEIFIYTKGKPAYHETQERYEDLKTPALHLGLYELQTVKTTISDLQRRCNDAAYNAKYYSGVPTSRGDHNDKTLRYTSAERPKDDKESFEDAVKNQVNKYDCNNKKNDPQVAKMYQDAEFQKSQQDFEDALKNQKVQIAHGRANDEWLEKKMLNAHLERQADKGNLNDNERHASSFRYRSKHWCNVLNTWAFMLNEYEAEHLETMWSYLTQNQTKMGKDGENWKHPTVKPVLLMERLIRLLTPKPTPEFTPVVVDFFTGSGTLPIAAVNVGVDFYACELQPEYVAISEFRINKAFEKRAENEPQADIADDAPINQLDIFNE